MRYFKLLLAYAICVMTIGCAAVQPIDRSTATYKSPRFSYDQFQNSGISILPVVTSEARYEGIRRMTGNEITEAFKKKFPYASINSPSLTLKKVNDNELSEKYSEMINSYKNTGILDFNTLKALGIALDSKYLVYSRLGAEESTDTRYSSSLGITQTKAIEVEIYVQVWDVEIGDIVWEGSGGAAALKGQAVNGEADIVELAANGLSNVIGKAPQNVSTPESTQSLHNKQQANFQLAYLGISVVALILVLLVTA